MKSLFLCGFVAIFMSSSLPAFAADQWLGTGRLFDNDLLGDGKDRWRTSSYAYSRIYGSVWTGALPERMGEILEYRFRAEIIAPTETATPDPNDRHYVGALSLGVHTHFQRDGIEMSLGVDAVFIGDQTGLSHFQHEAHDLLGGDPVNVTGLQVDDAVYPQVTFEAGRPYSLGEDEQVRPFVEIIAGPETLARLGADFTFGAFREGGLRLRDTTTGQRYAGIRGKQPASVSWLIGGDVAYVFDSRYLATPGVVAEDVRYRLRAGVFREWKDWSFFYGTTYLSREYETQSSGQFVGSLNIQMKF